MNISFKSTLEQMFLKNNHVLQRVLIVIFITLCTFVFLYSPGTHDVAIWERWAKNIELNGLFSGFEINNGDYPPLSSVILFCAVSVSKLSHLSVFISIKLSITIFLFLNTYIFWLYTKDFVLSIILHLSLLLNSVALAYIDIYFLPALIISLWSLKRRKYLLFTIFYLIACFIKWQPIIISPFIILYILNINSFEELKTIDLNKIFNLVILPTFIFFIIILYLFGIIPVITSFAKVLNHKFLSGNALNFNWILTNLAKLLFPENFGCLIDGQANYININSLPVLIIIKLPFIIFFLYTLYIYSKIKKNFEILIIFSLLSYLTYFIFNTDVHENHLLIAVVLSVILFWLNDNYLLWMLVIILMSNINMYLFYGADGTGLNFSRVIFNIDITFIFSIINVVLYLILFKICTSSKINNYTQVDRLEAKSSKAAKR